MPRNIIVGGGSGRILGSEYDFDALQYINNVEAMDGQPLEKTTKKAISKFVTSCKIDGTWNAIKSCCILAGAKTLDGCLVPLKGAAPTKYNFISTDYNRSTGLLSNASNKYLNTNRAHNADPQDNFHLAVYHHSSTVPKDSTGRYLIGARSPSLSGSAIGLVISPSSSERSSISAARSSFNLRSLLAIGDSFSAGFLAVTRNNSSIYTLRAAESPFTSNVTANSSSPDGNTNYLVFGLANLSNTLNSRLSARISFYSIGEGLDSNLLRIRVETLMSAFSTLT